MNKIFFFVFLLFFTNSIYARDKVATVVKLRGKVSILSPGAHSAHVAKLNDTLYEDASIVTYEGSFIRIKFKDGTTTSLGPKSKLIVTKMDSKGSGIITLLKGQLRSKVVKQSSDSRKHKLLIRTKSAALGVRGTDFQTIYNPENNITNLLTFEGEVAISKGDHKILAGESYEERAKVLSSNKLSRSQRHRLKDKLENIVESSLDSDKAVVVKGGQFSSSVGGVQSATLPVNISPTQLNSLYTNTELVQKVKTSQSSVITSSDKPSALKIVPQSAPQEGVFDYKSSKYAQKSGGFIDINSGLYIPPSASSEFSDKKKIYLAKNVGGIDAQTGQYVPPKGLVLDSKRGFVVKKVSDSKEVTRRIAEANKLNEVIEKDVVIRNVESVEPTKYYSQLELFTKDSISIKLSSVENKINHSNSNNTSNREASTTGKGLSITWNHSFSGKWQPIASFHYRNLRFDGAELGPFNQGSSNLFGMDIGIKRYISERLNMNATLKLKQDYYTAASDSLEYRLQKSTFTNLKVGGQYYIIKSKSYDVDLRASLAYIPTKTAKDVEVGSTSAIGFGAGFRYWFKRDTWLKLNIENESTSYEVTSTHYTATDDNSSLEIGLELGFVL